MADGTELFIGFSRDDIEPAAQALGLTIDWETGDLTPEATLTTLDKTLDYVYLQCLQKSKLFSDIKREPSVDLGNGHYVVTTPLGKRAMKPFALRLYYDPDEYGEEKDDAVLGVSLITRYFPTYLDWQEPHGGSGQPIYFDSTTNTMIETAQRLMLQTIPAFKNAYVCIKMMHY